MTLTGVSRGWLLLWWWRKQSRTEVGKLLDAGRFPGNHVGEHGCIGRVPRSGQISVCHRLGYGPTLISEVHPDGPSTGFEVDFGQSSDFMRQS